MKCLRGSTIASTSSWGQLKWVCLKKSPLINYIVVHNTNVGGGGEKSRYEQATKSNNNMLNTHVVVYPLSWPVLVEWVRSSRLWSTKQLLRPSGQQCTHPGVTMWCVCGCSWRDDVCSGCECYKGGIVVMSVIWRRLCVSMIWGRVISLFWVGKGCVGWGGEVSLQSC